MSIPQKSSAAIALYNKQLGETHQLWRQKMSEMIDPHELSPLHKLNAKGDSLNIFATIVPEIGRTII